MLLYFYARPLGMRTAQLYWILQCKLRNYRNLDFLLFSRVILYWCNSSLFNEFGLNFKSWWQMAVQRKCVAIFILHINYQYASSFSFATWPWQPQVRPSQVNLKSGPSCVNWGFFGTRGPLKREWNERFRLDRSYQKKPNLYWKCE
jgi:hypothetical protein